MLDAAGGIGDLNGVANAVLVFQDDIETRNDVAYEVLRAKTDGEAGESGDGGEGGDVQSEFLCRSEQGEGPNDFARAAINHGGKRAGLLFTCLGGFALRGSGLDDKPGNQFQKAVNEQSAYENDEEVQKIRDRK